MSYVHSDWDKQRAKELGLLAPMLRVPSYTGWVQVPDCAREELGMWAQEFESTNIVDAQRWLRGCSRTSTHAYIQDRRTGEVVDINTQQLITRSYQDTT